MDGERLSNLLAMLTTEDWQDLIERTKEGRVWHLLPWHHNKRYRDKPPNDPFAVQTPARGDPEVPAQRRLFYPSPQSRFSLGEKPVAYFSCDFAVNCTEIVKPFYSDAELCWDKLKGYLRGLGSPERGWFYYPIHVEIAADALLLDVSSLGAPLIRALMNHGKPEDYGYLSELLTTRDETDKLLTQEISVAAAKQGFDGLVYRSVRGPIDIMIPDWNLVVFSEVVVRYDI